MADSSPNPENSPNGTGAQTPEDRRDNGRARLSSPVQLHVEEAKLEGSADNISRSGVLFFTEGTLQVTVEIEEDGVIRSRNGRLVRSERIRGNQQGWAVEFE